MSKLSKNQLCLLKAAAAGDAFESRSQINPPRGHAHTFNNQLICMRATTESLRKRGLVVYMANYGTSIKVPIVTTPVGQAVFEMEKEAGNV